MFLYFLNILFLTYDGASVNSRKKKFNLFSPPFFFLPKQQKKKFKFIFSNVFPKTAEKIYLNLFSQTFFQKQQKKKFKFIFSNVFPKTAEKNKFKFFFSAVLVKKRWRK